MSANRRGADINTIKRTGIKEEEKTLNSGLIGPEHPEPSKLEERTPMSKMQPSRKDSRYQEVFLKPSVTFESLERRLGALAILAGVSYSKELYEPLNDLKYKKPVKHQNEVKAEQRLSKPKLQINIPKEPIDLASIEANIEVKPVPGTRCFPVIWSCPECTFHNKSIDISCKICLWTPIEDSTPPLPPSFSDYPCEDDNSWPKTIPSPPAFPKPKKKETAQSCPNLRNSSPNVRSFGYRITSDQFPVLEKKSFGGSQYDRRKSAREREYIRWLADDQALNEKFRKRVERCELSESPPPMEHNEEPSIPRPRPFTISDFMEPWEKPPANPEERVERAIRDERTYHCWRCETSIMPLWNYKNKPHSD